MRSVFLFVALVAVATAGVILWAQHLAAPLSPLPAPVPPAQPAADRPLLPSEVDTTRTHIVIHKSRRLLCLLEGDDTLQCYACVFGPSPQGDKFRQGDGRTPEGEFSLRSKYPHDKWSHFLWIDYPNDESWRRFHARKAAGEIPAEAKIGGEIGIHGTPSGYGHMIPNQTDWTLGCISVTREAVEELYPLLPVGGKILILP